MKRIQKLKKKITSKIKEIVCKFPDNRLVIYDIDMGCSPILDECDDYNFTYTLDMLYIKNGILYLDGSCSCANYTWREDTIGIEALDGVLDFLEDHKEEINDYISEAEEVIARANEE